MVVHWKKPIVRVASLSAIAMLLLSFGPKLHYGGRITKITMPWSYFESIPFVNNLLVSRLLLFVYLFVGVLVAVFLDGIWRPDSAGVRSPRTTARALASIAAVVVAYAFLFPGIPFETTRADVPSFFTSSDVKSIRNGSVALVAPFSRNTGTSLPMLWQAAADMRYKMPSGYATGRTASGRFGYLPDPTPLSERMEKIQNGEQLPPLSVEQRTELLNEIDADDVDTVIVGPMSQREAMVEFFTDLLGRRPTEVGGVEIWYDVRR
jgi:hypothetical protein